MTALSHNTALTRSLIALTIAMAVSCGMALSRMIPATGGPSALEWLEHPRPIADVTLVSTEGALPSSALRGHWHLVALGFTRCADVCPATLAQLVQLRAQLADDRVRVVFVSIDPARDTPAQLAAYVHFFGRDVIGLTGAQNALQRLAESLGMNFRSEGSGDTSRISHSPTIALIDPDGFLRGRLRPGFDLPSAVRELTPRIQSAS